MMRYYRLLGGYLGSELELPDLPEAAPGRVDWMVRVVCARPREVAAQELLGAAPVDVGVEVRLFRIPGGFRLTYDDTGSFDVLSEGAEVVWYRVPGVAISAVRTDLLGRVLALALHSAGIYCLHASAVELAGSAVGFMAPKFRGKSTLALALVRAGGRLIADDLLAIGGGDSPVALPATPRLRVWGDTVAAVRVGAASIADEAGKYVVDRLPAQRIAQSPTPLSTLYLLTPEAPVGDAVVRRPLESVPSTLALVGQSKLGALLGGEEREIHLGRAVALADKVQVYRLGVARALDRLPEVVGRLREWHGVGVGGEQLAAEVVA